MSSDNGYDIAGRRNQYHDNNDLNGISKINRFRVAGLEGGVLKNSKIKQQQQQSLLRQGGRPRHRQRRKVVSSLISVCCLVTVFRRRPLLVNSTSSLPSPSHKSTSGGESVLGKNRKSCAINLYGLPRSFRHSVLPSLVVNVMEVNKKYFCDYYVHAYNTTHEPKSRSGNGGPINAEDVFLLRDALKMVYQSENNGNDGIYGDESRTLPTVRAVFDTDADFQSARSKELRTMIDDWQQNDSRPNPYMLPKKDGGSKALRNVIKMWHSQDRVWKLMEDGSEEKRQKMMDDPNIDYGKDNGIIGKTRRAENNDNHYDRVMMLRLDVVYVTPIDVWRSRHDYSIETIRTDGQGHLRHKDNGLDDPYFIDSDENLSALIPGFAMFPVNDRMISGPYNAAKVWASERFERAEAHVMETRIIINDDQGDNNQTTEAGEGGRTATREIIIPPKIPVGKGLHDETFVAKTLLPAIINEHNISVHVDPGLWFMRVRADGSIWILDTPNLNRYTAKLGDEELEAERQKLETVFQIYYDMIRRYQSHSDGTINDNQRAEMPLSRSDRGYKYCDDIYEVRTEGVSSAAAFQIKCPPPLSSIP